MLKAGFKTQQGGAAAAGGIGERIYVPGYFSPTTETGWVFQNPVTLIGGITNTVRNDSQTNQNDERTYDLVLSAGTWNLEVVSAITTIGGIWTFQMDGVTFDTWDSYAAVAVPDYVVQVAPVVVATTGTHTLRFLIATKNPLSALYYASLRDFQLVRTA
jgi:hypothetical protein